MPKRPTTIKQLDRIYDKYKEYFITNSVYSFHNLLWQIIVNQVWKNKICVIHPVITSDGLFVGRVDANSKGYVNMCVEFAGGCPKYEDMIKVCDELNSVLFDIKPSLGELLVSYSMSGDGTQHAPEEAVNLNEEAK